MKNQYERRFDSLATTLDLSTEAQQVAKMICHRAFANDLHQRSSAAAVVASALYTAARHAGAPFDLTEIADVAAPDRATIGRGYKLLVRELDLEQNLDLELPAIDTYVDRFSSELGLQEATTKTAHELVEMSIDAGIHSGRSPAGMAASAVYLAGLLTDASLTQQEAVEATPVSSSTIRTRYQEQAVLLGIGRQQHSPSMASAFDTCGLSMTAINEQLDHFEIVDLGSDLFASRARCRICGQNDSYRTLLIDHHTQWIGGDRFCYNGELSRLDLDEHLDWCEVLEMGDRLSDATVRCLSCGTEGRYGDMGREHSPRPGTDRPRCS